MDIRDELILRQGSVESASRLLESWFELDEGISRAYYFFINKVGTWPWNPLVWKRCLLPKHRIALWLFAHGKFLTRGRQCYILDKNCVMQEAIYDTLVLLLRCDQRNLKGYLGLAWYKEAHGVCYYSSQLVPWFV